MVPPIRKSSLQEIQAIGHVQIQGVVGQPVVTPREMYLAKGDEEHLERLSKCSSG